MARAKDADGRLQKNHFGQQRLSILAKGLGRALAAPTRIRSREDTIRASISLGHAHKSHDKHDDEDYLAPRADVGAYTQRSETPQRKRRKVDPPSSSDKSRSSRSSTVLRELSISERNVYRSPFL